MRSKLIIIILSLLFLNSTAQIPTEKNIRTVESLIDSAYEKTLTADMKGSSLFAKKALQISREKGYVKGEAYSNFYLAQGLFELQAYKQALYYLHQAETINNTLKDKFLSFEIYRIRSRVYGSMELLQASAREQEKGLSIISQIPRSQEAKNFLTGLAYENLAIAYSKTGDTKSYLHYLLKNKELLEHQDPKLVYTSLITLYAMLGDYYTIVKDYNKAEFYFQKSEATGNAFQFPYISFTYQRWGIMELEKENPEKALAYFKKSLDILNKTNFPGEIPVIYNRMALAYEQLGNKQKSDEYHLKSLKLKDALKTEQLKASAQAVEEILKDENQKITKQFSEERYILLAVITAAVIIAAVIILKYTRKKENKLKKESSEQLIEKEKENLLLQQKVNDSFDDVIQLAKTNSREFWARFQEVYPHFRNRMLEVNPDLKQTELILCAYIYLGFTAKDIADYTFKALKTIKNNKYNLRKRLDIPTKDDLVIWIRNQVDH